jgi:hypothetical protein
MSRQMDDYRVGGAGYIRETKNREDRRRASIQRSDFIRLAETLRSHGVILDQRQWMIEIAYCLTSASEGLIRSFKIKDYKAPYWRGHEDEYFASTLRACGFETSEKMRREAIDHVWAIRTAHNWWGMRDIDKVGAALGITTEIRIEAGARLVGAIGETPKIREDARRKRCVASKASRRRQSGCARREDYEANSLSKTRPWEPMGISRRTWERRRAANLLPVAANENPNGSGQAAASSNGQAFAAASRARRIDTMERVDATPAPKRKARGAAARSGYPVTKDGYLVLSAKSAPPERRGRRSTAPIFKATSGGFMLGVTMIGASELVFSVH